MNMLAGGGGGRRDQDVTIPRTEGRGQRYRDIRRLMIALATGLAVALALLTGGPDTQAGLPKQRGMSYAGYVTGQYSQPDAGIAMGSLAATGASWVSVIVTGYQPTISSTAITAGTAVPTDGELARAIEQAHRLGLKVMLKPHLDLSGDPAHWRGQIGPGFASEAEWGAWFTSYRQFMEHYADLAQANGVEQFSVGTELLGTTHRTGDWRALVAALRGRYGGPMVYAADWAGEAVRIDWWDALDYIGVDAYYPLTDRDGPSVAELNAGWGPHLAELADLSSRWDKPIIFTEIGYQSRVGANRNPSGGPGSLDLQEQSNAYQAVFESVYGRPWLAGIFWWFWGTDPFQGGACDTDFTPHDKPAEDVLRAGFGAPPRAALGPAPGPDYSHTTTIYGDSLGPGWDDWSWDAPRDLASTGQVFSGTRAISVTLGAYGGLSVRHPPFDSDYYWLELYVRGSPEGEQHLWAFFNAADGTELRKRPVDDCRYMAGGTIDPGDWKRVLIPMSDLNPNGRPLSRLSLQERRGLPSTAFWVDEIRLAGRVTRLYLPVLSRNGD